MKPKTGHCASRYTAIAFAAASIAVGASGCSEHVRPLQRLEQPKVEVACEDTEEGCPAPSPKVPCPEIDQAVNHCPGWAGSDERDSCDSFTPAQDSCVADILNDLAESGDECINWYEPRIICFGKHLGLEGYASCAIQDCLGLTTLDECAMAYEIQCGWTL